MCIGMKNLIWMIFVKSHKWKFSHVVEMVQLIHIQCMTKYFTKFGNCLNGFCNIFALGSILLLILYFQKYII